MLKMIKVFIFIVLIFSLFGCPEVTEKKELESGVGSINISITVLTGKTISPPGEDTEAAYFVINGSGPQDKSFEIIPTESSATVDNLLSGEWEISIVAYNSKEIPIGFGKSTVDVQPNKTAEAFITINAIDGLGSLKIAVKNENEETEGFSVKAILAPYGNTNSSALAFVKNDNSFRSITTDLETGYYTLSLQVFHDQSFIGGIAETVWVVNELTSTMEYEFEYNSSTGSVVIIPVLDMNKPINVNIYQMPSNTLIEDTLVVENGEEVTLRAQVDVIEPVRYEWYVNGIKNENAEGDRFTYTYTSLSNTSISVIAILLEKPCGGSKSITVNSAIDRFIIDATAGSGGSISPNGMVPVNAGENQIFTITPAACSTIADVLVDGVSMGAITTYTFEDITSDHEISASFNTFGPFTITATAGPGGAITPGGDVTVQCGDDPSFEITPDSCYEIADVLVDGVSQGAITSYTFDEVSSDHEIAVSFTPFGPYTITASAGSGGTITPRGDVSVTCGDDRSFTITSDSCHEIADVVVDGVSMGAINSYTFNDVSSDHEIAVSYNSFGPFTITATAGSGGTITSSSTGSLSCGEDRRFTITPASCYDVADVLVDGASMGAITSYTFNDVTSNHTILARFRPLGPFTITATAGSGGMITSSGPVSVNCGANQSYTITPTACYDIANVVVDGVSQGAITSYTFPDVDSNHRIEATFRRPGPFSIVTTAGTGGSINISSDAPIYCGDSRSITITPDTCYDIVDVVVDGVSRGAITSFPLNDIRSNHIIHATFRSREMFTLRALDNHVDRGGGQYISGGDVTRPANNEAESCSGVSINISCQSAMTVLNGQGTYTQMTFSRWVVISGDAIIADPYSQYTSVTLNGDATIQPTYSY